MDVAEGQGGARLYMPLDGSVQPLLLTIPAAYDGKPTRLDIVLHGRSQRLLESNWICYDRRPRTPRRPNGCLRTRQDRVCSRRRIPRTPAPGTPASFSSRCLRAATTPITGRARSTYSNRRRRAAAFQDRRFAARAARVLACSRSAERARGTSRCIIQTDGWPQKSAQAHGRVDT